MTMSRRKFLLASGAGVAVAPGLAGLAAGGGGGGVEVDAVREASLWISEAPPMPDVPRLEGDRKVDLAIIGAGYTGLACAYYAKLFRPNWSVVVLESHEIGSGASSRNSGAVTSHHSGLDAGMLERRLGRLRDFIDAEEIDCNFGPASTLQMSPSKKAAEKARADLSHGARWISADELSEKTGSQYFSGAVDTPGIFRVHPAKLVLGHAEAALKAGVEIFERSPALKVESGRPARITTPRGTVTADNVFLATNAYTPRLGFFASHMYPVHQYSFATRQLTPGEIKGFGLDQWNLRFEERTLPVSFGLTAGNHFFVRIVLGYASRNSCQWRDIEGAQNLARRIFEQRYPQIADIGLSHGWHGVTGHTLSTRQIAGVIGEGNMHISAAYNGSGILPSHNNGYLTACRITGRSDQDTGYLTGTKGQIRVPGAYYRSLLLKPGMKMLAPV